MSQSVFQVNLEGILRILSESLYSTPQVFLRELIQNSSDAITARKQLENFQPNITIDFFENDAKKGLIFKDNGIGLTKEEVELFLSKIGASSKSGKDVDMDRSSYIGQFGIGMLSCFMISDEIIVRTKSVKNPQESVKWVGKIDGTYHTEIVEESFPECGTKVILTIRKDVELTSENICELVKEYATYIPIPVKLNINEVDQEFQQQSFSWNDQSNQVLALQQGMDFFRERFDLSFPIDLPELETYGKVYVLNRTTNFGERGTARVYIKNMLIVKENAELLPQWGFFLRLVINSSHLGPTASREEVFKNSRWEDVKKAIERQLKTHFIALSANHPQLMESIVGHHYVALKSLAISDSDFARIIVPLFRYETSQGVLSLGEIVDKNNTLLYVDDVEEYQRIAPLAKAGDQLIINAGYIHDHALFESLRGLYSNHVIQRIDAAFFGQSLKNLSFEEQAAVEIGEKVIQDFLEVYHCQVQVKQFEPSTIPAMFTVSEEARKSKDQENIKEDMDSLWSFFTESITAEQTVKPSVLVLNIQNSVVRKLLTENKHRSSRIIAETILFNAMMQANIPLNHAEQQQLNLNLNYLLENLIR